MTTFVHMTPHQMAASSFQHTAPPYGLNGLPAFYSTNWGWLPTDWDRICLEGNVRSVNFVDSYLELSYLTDQIFTEDQSSVNDTYIYMTLVIAPHI